LARRKFVEISAEIGGFLRKNVISWKREKWFRRVCVEEGRGVMGNSRKTALALLLALLLTLPGCSGESVAASVQWQGRAAVPQSETDGADEAAPTQDEVLSAYGKAKTAYGWFARAPLPCGGDAVMVGTDQYRRVEYAGVATLAELETYLRSLFSREVVDRLLPEDGVLYRDIDGQLCALSFSHPADPLKGAETVTAEEAGPEAWSVNVTVELLSEDGGVIGLEGYSFPYENVDGRWVFTDFALTNAT